MKILYTDDTFDDISYWQNMYCTVPLHIRQHKLSVLTPVYSSRADVGLRNDC